MSRLPECVCDRSHGLVFVNGEAKSGNYAGTENFPSPDRGRVAGDDVSFSVK